mgnify:CR=1 FL=1
MKHLIVGGVAGGATAAARLRRLTENDEIILFEKGEYISYANCGLPYYIGGTIADREQLLVLLSPGASPVTPPLPGIDREGIFTLRNVTATDRIKAYLTQHTVKRALIIGGGFIGLEMAENLVEAGAEVGIVEMADQVMAPID